MKSSKQHSWFQHVTPFGPVKAAYVDLKRIEEVLLILGTIYRWNQSRQFRTGVLWVQPLAIIIWFSDWFSMYIGASESKKGCKNEIVKIRGIYKNNQISLMLVLPLKSLVNHLLCISAAGATPPMGLIHPIKPKLLSRGSGRTIFL